ncbi:hypothetical protein [Cellulosimicrobium sp. NPDC057862]|uniref:NucA/NucB deoxyribonuclease domain-containing protein n=1 Tax=Actinomycetes TaxID=1760 RepID=UPI0036731907
MRNKRISLLLAVAMLAALSLPGSAMASTAPPVSGPAEASQSLVLPDPACDPTLTDCDTESDDTALPCIDSATATPDYEGCVDEHDPVLTQHDGYALGTFPIPRPTFPKTSWPVSETGGEYEYCEETVLEDGSTEILCAEKPMAADPAEVESMFDEIGEDPVVLDESLSPVVEANLAAGRDVPEGSSLSIQQGLETGTAASVAATGYAVVKPPSSCTTATSRPLTWRTSSCMASKATTVSYIRQGGAIRQAGSLTKTVVVYVYTDTKSSQVFNQTSVRRTMSTGNLQSGVSISGSFKCSSYCTGKTGSLTKQPLLANTIHAIGRLAPEITYGKSATVRSNWSFTITKPGALPSGVFASYSLSPRCDNNAVAGMGKGCVFPAGPISLVHYRTGAYSLVTAHISQAINSGLPSTLTRTTTAIKTANRNKACPKTLTRPTGHECDEYPFASTAQGASAGGTARVFAGCKLPIASGSGSVGFSRCMVLTGHNRTAGTMLTTFYKDNRVLVGDKFTILVR